MIDFKSVVLEDRELLTSFLWSADRQDNNLSFANLCCWQFLTCSSYAILRDQLVFRFCFPENRVVYTLPGGESAGKEVIRLLARQAKEEDIPLYLYGIVSDMQPQLEKNSRTCSNTVPTGIISIIYICEPIWPICVVKISRQNATM